MENDSQQPATAPEPNQPKPDDQKKQLPSAFDLIKPSWEAIRLNLNTFLLLAIFPVLAIILNSVVTARSLGNSNNTNSSNYHPAGFLITLLVLFIVVLITQPMFLYTASKSSKGEKVSLDEAINGGFKFFFRLVGLGIVVLFFVVGGLILLIVPGIFMIKRFIMSPYIMIDNDFSVGETVRQTKAISKQYSGPIWGVVGVTALIGCVSVIPFIGSIISIILGLIYNLAPALRYQQIKRLGPVAQVPITNPMPPSPT